MTNSSSKSQVGKLEFDNDKGAGRSKWIAGAFTLALVGWMGSGFIVPTEPADEEKAEETSVKAITVAVIQSQAQDIALVLAAEGQSEPDRSTEITSNASGQVIEVTAKRGDLVTAGQELGRIDATISTAQLTQAQQQVRQAKRDLANAEELVKRGIGTEDRVTAARASAAAAEAALTAAQDQFDKAIIRAPFAGRLNNLSLDVGEYVSGGDPVAEVVDNDPLSVVVQVPQQALSQLSKGQQAQIEFITGEKRVGVIDFVGSNADAQTRTFRVEIAVENPDSVMPAGLSAKVIVPTGKDRGHFISPAILSLDSEGLLGIKTVDADNRVQFEPIEIVRAQTDGIWVTGLGENSQIITVGQGFVNAGDLVDPQDEAALAAAAAKTAEVDQ